MANLNDVKKSKTLAVTLSDGNDYELCFDLNALAELEDRYGDVDTAFKQMEAGSFKAIRCVMWAGLLHHHPDFTEQQVGSLMDMNSMQTMMEQLNTALGEDMPTPAEGVSPN